VILPEAYPEPGSIYGRAGPFVSKIKGKEGDIETDPRIDTELAVKIELRIRHMIDMVIGIYSLFGRDLRIEHRHGDVPVHLRLHPAPLITQTAETVHQVEIGGEQEVERKRLHDGPYLLTREVRRQIVFHIIIIVRLFLEARIDLEIGIAAKDGHPHRYIFQPRLMPRKL